MASTAARSRILVVDDDASVRLALRLILDEHHDVVEASDGGAALASLEADRVDVMVLDLLLPKMDGFEVLERARAFPRRIPVIVISGLNTSWTAAAAMRLGAVDYLTKPFDDRDLLAAIAETLETEEAERPGAPSAGPPLILCVGVDVSVRATLSVILGDHGRLQAAGDVAAALLSVKAVRPDMIAIQLSEDMLRVHPEPVARLRREFPDGPIIVIAGDQEMRAAPGRHDGGLTLLRKPAPMSALLQQIGASLPRPALRPRPFSTLTLEILDYLAEHHADATIKRLGQRLHRSPYYLSAGFRQEVGTQPRRYLRTLRIEMTKLLLVETPDSIDDIAKRVGLHDASHLSRIFIAQVGRRPGVYRKEERPTLPAPGRDPRERVRILAGRPWSSVVEPPVPAVDPFTTPVIRVIGEERVAFDVAQCTGELSPPRFFDVMMTEALRDADALTYAPSGVALTAFADAVDAYLAGRGVNTRDATVLTTSGTSTSLEVLARAFGSTGAIVAVEHPTWPVALAVFAAAGLRVLGIPVDDEGLRVDLLAAALQKHPVRFVYLQPAFQNPTGVSLSAGRRRELLEVAARFGTVVVEDDFAADLAYDEVPPPLRTDEGAQGVVYLKSFSKLLTPALRIAVLVAPRQHERALREAQHSLDPFPSTLAQAVVARCLGRDEFGQHVQRVRALLDARWQALSGALETRMPEGVQWTVPRGGLCTWMELPPPLTAVELLVDVAKGGVGFTPGPVFCLDGSGQRGARLAFGATSPTAIERGVRHMAQAIRARLRHPSRVPSIGSATTP